MNAIGLTLKRLVMTALVCLVACCLILPGCSGKKASKSGPYGPPPPIPKEEQLPATQPAPTDAPGQR
ncbi:MAG: hypothetical protein NT031_00940 [Planctomycetota bacterium]|nr:hypothetical protein [Planctomycetota bacterium]